MHRQIGWICAQESGHQALQEKLCSRISRTCLTHHYSDSRIGLASSLAVAQEGDLFASICGRPRFADPALSTLSPALALLTLWRQHAHNAPKFIHGNFTCAIIDREHNEVFVALDRTGTEKLAYAYGNDYFVFSSQSDVVATHPLVGAQLSPQGIFNYCYFYQVPAPGSIFSNVEKLLPAQWVHWRSGTVTKGFYWALKYRDEPRQDFDSQSHRFMELLRQGVARARSGDEVAAFLSGGTDSSTVSGMLRDQVGRARTYSIGFNASGFDEIEYARIAAKHFDLDSREYYLTQQDVVDAIPVIASHYDEPFANESAVPTYACAKRAAEDGYRVMLAGDGGDEYFGGNERYAKQKIFERYFMLPSGLRQGVIEPLLNQRWLQNVPVFGKARSYVKQANIPLPHRLESYNHLNRQPLENVFRPDFLATLDPGMPGAMLSEVYSRADTGSYINRMLHLDLKFTLADNDLRKVGGMTEAAGIEVRYPLLDDDLVEFSGEVPPDWKVRGSYLRWFFKRSLRGYLPDAIIDKSKHGFGLPFGLWLQEYAPLKERAYDRLSDFSRRDYIRPGYIAELKQQHATSHATYYGRMIWLLMMLEEWLSVRKI